MAVPSADARLADVLANPEDLPARRAYADALTAAGDPRGDFITVECDLEHAPIATPAWTDLRRRRGELLAKHGKAWLAPYGKMLRSPTFRRGMIEEAVVDTKHFLPAMGDLLEREPVTSLWLSGLTARDMELLAARPELPRLRELTFRSCDLYFSQGAHDVPQRLSGLRRLVMDQCTFQLGVDHALAERVYPHLEELTLGVKTLTADQLSEVTSQGSTKRVTSLALPWLPGIRDLVEEIAQQLRQPQLRRLDLAHNHFNLAALERFVTNKTIAALRSFGLEQNLVHGGAEVVAVLAALPHLEELDLSTNKLGPSTGAAIASRAWPLRSLVLGQTQLGDDGMAALARAALPGLRTLGLNNTRLGPAGAAALASAAWPIERLVLSQNDLGDVGAAAIAKSALPRTLRSLDLHACKLTDKGVAALAAAEWPALEHLALSSNTIGAGGAKALGAASMPALQTLSLKGTDAPKGPLAPARKRGVELSI
jgi:uncharacterized protein (TIGR02996 family)